ncbi:MAG: S26 family signal peptidase [Labedaea sp.]
MTRRYRQVQVDGNSMSPTLAHRDLVLVRMDTPAHPDDLVLVSWPSRPGQLSIKRAAWPEDAGWFVVGDNPLESTDSNHLGPARVLGVILWRLWPRPRRLR